MAEYNPLIEPYAYPHDVTGEVKHFIGSKVDRSCMFCGEREPKVTFEKEAHIIPAGLGNRTLFNLNECDTCNEKHFSPKENEIVNYLTFDRIFIRARKRSGKPKHKTAGRESFMESTPLSNMVHIHIKEEEGTFEVEEVGEKQLRLTIKNLPPYSPEDICKTLTHMAWPLLPEKEKQALGYIPDWLLGKTNIFPLYLDLLHVPKTGYSNVILEIWKAKQTSDYPILIRFTYGFKILTFYVPLNPTIKSQPKPLDGYIQLDESMSVNAHQFIIKQSGRRKQENIQFTFNYERRDELPDSIKGKLKKSDDSK